MKTRFIWLSKTMTTSFYMSKNQKKKNKLVFFEKKYKCEFSTKPNNFIFYHVNLTKFN